MNSSYQLTGRGVSAMYESALQGRYGEGGAGRVGVSVSVGEGGGCAAECEVRQASPHSESSRRQWVRPERGQCCCCLGPRGARAGEARALDDATRCGLMTEQQDRNTQDLRMRTMLVPYARAGPMAASWSW